MTAELQDLFASASHARPEALLAAFSLLFIVVGVWSGQRSFGLVCALGVLTLIGAAVLAVMDQPLAPIQIFQGELSIDAFAVFAKVLIALAAGANLALGADHF